jgi:hypothetical protein
MLRGHLRWPHRRKYHAGCGVTLSTRRQQKLAHKKIMPSFRTPGTWQLILLSLLKRGLVQTYHFCPVYAPLQTLSMMVVLARSGATV